MRVYFFAYRNKRVVVRSMNCVVDNRLLLVLNRVAL